MTNARLEDIAINLRGINVTMTSPGVTAFQASVAQRIAADAGPGFEVVSRPHKWVARHYIQPGTARARRAEAVDKALTRAVGAASQ